ncbi:hypothetical protein J7E64_22850 [Priestia megaterium]|nr:hypothetical protein [Priestia megaterium]
MIGGQSEDFCGKSGIGVTRRSRCVTLRYVLYYYILGGSVIERKAYS